MHYHNYLVKLNLQPSRARAVYIGENEVTDVECGPPCGLHTQGLEIDWSEPGAFARNNIVSTARRLGI
jgi:hypothetical protein